LFGKVVSDVEIVGLFSPALFAAPWLH